MSKQPRPTKPQPNVLHEATVRRMLSVRRQPKPAPKKKANAKSQPNVLDEATVRRMLATPPQAKKKPVKKAGSKKKR
jgi:hypothetical protein